MNTMLRLQQNEYVKRSEIIVKDGVINAKNQCVTGGQQRELPLRVFGFAGSGKLDKDFVHAPGAVVLDWWRKKELIS